MIKLIGERNKKTSRKMLIFELYQINFSSEVRITKYISQLFLNNLILINILKFHAPRKWQRQLAGIRSQREIPDL